MSFGVICMKRLSPKDNRRGTATFWSARSEANCYTALQAAIAVFS